MCGIVGVASPTAFVNRPPLTAMRDRLQHRGPDDAGEWWSDDERVGLAHRRLSILELSALGHQPMLTSDKRLAIVFNGEIYNFAALKQELESLGHHFRSHSDTEVILEAYRAWGADCVTHLRGMFAFVLHDVLQQRVVLARDRAGEKPMFYAMAGGVLRFASELKALLADPAVPRVMDVAALDSYLMFGYVPGEQCLVAGVRKLPAGNIAIFDLKSGELQRATYWRLPAPPSEAVRDENALVDRLDVLLEASVREQMVADVPVGVLLSGGVDSSLVTAMAARISSSAVRTFTITFPGAEEFNEGPYAKIVAKHFGTEHHELTAAPASVELLPALVRQYDEPIADSSMIPTYLVSTLIRPHCTVALGGDGGDELFGGYLLYEQSLQQEHLRNAIPALLRRPLGSMANHLPVGVRGRIYAQKLALDWPTAVAQSGIQYDRATRVQLSPLLANTGLTSLAELLRRDAALGVGDALQQLTRADFASYMCDDILVKVDRASMLASLEVRAPFLDQRIIEFAFSEVPRHLRLFMNERKILPRRLAKRLLPAELDINRKRGFSVPLEEWMRGAWGHSVERDLESAPAALFNRNVVKSLFAGQRRGRNNGQRLFALAMLELWRREYNIELPEPSTVSRVAP